jgi:hypothetical protein
MADETRYLVPTQTAPRVYPTLSGYLNSIALHGPPTKPGSLPSKLQAAKAAAAKAEQAKKEKEKTWIEIVLVDALDQPVAGKKYSVELPDGSKKEGTLDDQGKAKLENLDPGMCKISFPEIESNAFGPAPPPWEPPEGPPETTWVELVLLDDQREPVAGAKFVVETSDGTRHEGTTGNDGRAMLEGLKPGPCKISFPEFEAGSLEPLSVGG